MVHVLFNIAVCIFSLSHLRSNFKKLHGLLFATTLLAYMARLVVSLILLAASAWGQADWYPWVQDFGGTAIKVADLSNLNHIPAGKHGGLKMVGDKFAFSDGTPAVFWGTDLSGSACFPTKENADKVAADLARLGYNLVRFHHIDAPWVKPFLFESIENTRKLAVDPVDRMDYFISQLKKRGIYVYMNLLSLREMSATDFGGHVDPGVRASKVAGYWNRFLFDIQKEFIKQLLDHPNPYLGTTNAKDPALAMVGLVNEVSIFDFIDYTFTGEYHDDLDSLWKAWCTAKSITRPAGDINTLKSNRVFQRFLADRQGVYIRDMRDYLKSLGYAGVVAGTAVHGGTPGTLGNILGNAEGDFIMRHFYWEVPQAPDTTVTQQSMLKNIRNTGSGNNWRLMGLNYAAPSQVVNMPMTVAEWGFIWPTDVMVEGPLLIAAYGGLQGWDAPIQYAYAHDAGFQTGKMWGLFEDCNKPHLLAANLVAGKIFRRGDVPQAKNGYVQKLSTATNDSSFYGPPLPNMPGYLPLTRRVGLAVERTGLAAVTEVAETTVPGQIAGKDEFVSENGILTWNKTDGIFTLNSDKSQGVVGFIKGRTLIMKNIKVAMQTDYCQVTAVSLDDLPIATSKSILLLAIARAQNTGQTWNATRTKIVNQGTEPILMEPVKGVVTLLGINSLFVHVLDHKGQRSGRMVATQKVAEGIQFSIGSEQSFWYELSTETPVWIGKSKDILFHSPVRLRLMQLDGDTPKFNPIQSSAPMSILDLGGRKLWESHPGTSQAEETGSGVRILVPKSE